MPQHKADERGSWWADQPCIAVALLQANNLLSRPAAEAAEYAAAPTPQWRVQLYSLRRHAYFHHIALTSRVLGLKASCRILAVALENQVLSIVVLPRHLPGCTSTEVVLRAAGPLPWLSSFQTCSA